MESLLYLGIMLAVMLLWFALLRRPVYEAALVSFLVLLTITGKWSNVWVYVESAMSTSLLYSMLSFTVMSVVLTKTKIVDSCVAVILSLVGRITGGAGYAAVVASSFMGALSGSGPGNVMATGSLTIPAMKRSGFPPELAANIESNASYLGNMIPPSANIVAAMGAFAAVYPSYGLSTGKFWVLLWGIALYFIAQRLLMVYAFCKYYKVKPLSKEQLPDLKQTLRSSWQGLLFPVIIIVPFVLDFFLKDGFFARRLGAAGAKAFSGSLLLFIGGISILYACLICKDKQKVTPAALANMVSDSVKSLAPTIAVCLFGYMIGELFGDLDISQSLGALIGDMRFGKLGTVLIICVLTCFMGMAIPGSSQVVIFGPMFISLLAGVGVSPLLAAAMLPCICGVMSGITPPLALGMYAGMAIAGSEYGKTVRNDLWWVAAQITLEVMVLMGWLPIIGL